MYVTYILKSLKSGRHYIGSTEDIDRRLSLHNSGKVSATRNKGPWLVIHSESYQTRKEAYQREQKIKSYKGGTHFKQLID